MLTHVLAAVCILGIEKPSEKLLISQLPQSVFTTAERRVFNLRRRYAERVEQLLIDDGHTHTSIRLAVLANGWHECKFDPSESIVDANGANSAGFFMLNSRGVGKGMSVAAKKDIPTAYERLINWPTTRKWLTYAHKQDPGTAAFSYASKVMVCHHPSRPHRRETAKRWAAALKKAGVPLDP